MFQDFGWSSYLEDKPDFAGFAGMKVYIDSHVNLAAHHHARLRDLRMVIEPVFTKADVLVMPDPGRAPKIAKVAAALRRGGERDGILCHAFSILCYYLNIKSLLIQGCLQIKTFMLLSLVQC